MKKLFVFDFDGTLTNADTLLEFIRFACGRKRMLLGFLLYSPLLVLMKARLYPNYKAKQKVFAHFFKGMTLEQFDTLCQAFARQGEHLLRPAAVRFIDEVRDEAHAIAIVSASIDNWGNSMTAPTSWCWVPRWRPTATDGSQDASLRPTATERRR